MAINIIDVSSVIYSGLNANYRAEYKGIQTGGLHLLAQHIAKSYRYGDTIILCFDSKTSKRDILPEYKGSRPRDPRARFSTKFAYDYLKDVIPNTFKCEGYEADDIAYNCCERLRSLDSAYVELLTADYDWAHNITDNRQQIVPANHNICQVTAGNFSTIFSERDFTVPVNSISALKVFTQDNSDKIPSLTGSSEMNAKYFNQFVVFCDKNKLNYRDKISVLRYVRSIKDSISEELYSKMIARTEVVFPQPIKETLSISFDKINIQGMSRYLSLIGSKRLCDKLEIPYYSNMGEEQNLLREELGKESRMTTTQYFKRDLSEELVINNRGGIVYG